MKYKRKHCAYNIQFEGCNLLGKMSRSRAGDTRKRRNTQDMTTVQSIEKRGHCKPRVFSKRREEQPRTRQAGNPWNVPRKASKTDI
jgi:hypothetical protein